MNYTSYVDIYLDINEGNEILNAVEQAFDYELLIFRLSSNSTPC